jgi:carboxyl-terminal processing protease
MRVSQQQGFLITGWALAVLSISSLSQSSTFGADSIGSAKTAEPSKATAPRDEQKHVENIARRIFAITDVVLEHHVEPATRQEMILAGLKAGLASKKASVPDLSRKVSDLRTAEELSALLQELWPKLTKAETPSGGENKQSPGTLERAIFEGLLHPVAGHAYYLPAKEARVQAQIQANRYIGIGIALGLDDKSHLPQIKMVQPGGPARLGGVRPGDLIEEINHVRITPLAPKASISGIVDRLRGPEGSELTIRVRQPDAKESRTLALVRLPVMFKSVKCSAENADEDRIILLNAKPAIAYLKIDSVMASTARELASWEPRLREAGVQGLILDLRGTGGSVRGGFDSYHSALLLADSLLDGKPLGKLVTREGRRPFVADRDCLFRDLPLAVLTDENTSGPAEWVAAALQDADPPAQKRRRAVIVGDRTLREADNYVRSAFVLPGGDESLILATAAWERPNVKTRTEETSDGEEMAATDSKFLGRVIPDVKYEDVVPDGLQTAVAQLAQVVKQTPKTTAEKTAALQASQQDADRRYKQAAITELRRQIELIGKPVH